MVSGSRSEEETTSAAGPTTPSRGSPQYRRRHVVDRAEARAREISVARVASESPDRDGERAVAVGLLTAVAAGAVRQATRRQRDPCIFEFAARPERFEIRNRP